MALASPRMGGSVAGGLPADQQYQQFYNQYLANWGDVQKLLGEMAMGQSQDAIIQALLAAQQPETVTVPGETTIINEAPRERRRDRMAASGGGFTGGGYAQPGQVNNAVSGGGGWGSVLAALGAAQSPDVDRAARQARRAERRGEVDGSYTIEPRERDRVRTRSRTGKDGETTTTTVNISRDGGTAYVNESGSDGERKRKKRAV